MTILRFMEGFNIIAQKGKCKLGSHCLIIGGTKGAGKITAAVMAAKGARVSVIARKKPGDSEFVSCVHYYSADVTHMNNTRAVLDDIIKTGGPVNNVLFFQRFRGKTDAWNNEMAVSLTATRDIIEYLSDRFSSSGQKNIVIVSSVASDLVACEQGPEYHVAKAGLVQMTRYYAVSLGRRGIRVNCICPAIVMKDEAKPYYEKHEAAVRLFESITPLGRMGTPEDIAGLAQFLCSAEASFITGQSITVDGGLTLQMQASLCLDKLLE